MLIIAMIGCLTSDLEQTDSPVSADPQSSSDLAKPKSKTSTQTTPSNQVFMEENIDRSVIYKHTKIAEIYGPHQLGFLLSEGKIDFGIAHHRSNKKQSVVLKRIVRHTQDGKAEWRLLQVLTFPDTKDLEVSKTCRTSTDPKAIATIRRDDAVFVFDAQAKRFLQEKNQTIICCEEYDGGCEDFFQ